MIDVHAHFAEEGYEFPAEWERIRAAGVSETILAGDTVVHSEMHRAYAEQYEGCFFTVGVHPENAETPLSDGDLEKMRALARHEKCVAVGEIGLDYHYPGFDRKKQRDLFVIQLLLAGELSLPVQIHSRDACADTVAILREYQKVLKNGFLMHCYGYGREELETFLSFGAYFSFGGVICFKNARRAVESVESCPMERILSETDSPYLSPFRGEKNSPANIPVIVSKIAAVKGVFLEEAERAIGENALRLFPKLK